MKYSAYPQYKDSGVAWLGEVPEHWKVERLHDVSQINTSNVDKKTVDGQETIRLCNYVDVYKNDKITENIEFMRASASKSEIERFHLEKGDVIITKDSESPFDIGVPALIDKNIEDLICGYHLSIIKPLKNILHGPFLFYVLSAKVSAYQFTIASNGVTRFGLSLDGIKNIKAVIPNINEQRAIADFLDKKTSQIDELIEKKKILIKKLNEQRISLITKAVTKGLDDSVPMKGSGVAWLGKVPEHWKIISAKICYNIQLGKMLQTKPESSTDEELNYLKALHVTWSGVVVDALPFMWCSKVNSEKYAVKNGDLLVCEGGEVGRASILQNLKGSCIIQNALHRVRDSGRGNVQFFCYLLKSISNSGWFDIVCNKATIAHLTYEKLGALQIPVPSLSEQQAIANFLDKKTAQINTMVEKLKATITKLEEYRTTIITAAVTGKIDVRNYEKQQK